ncbi:MAG: hypothetical protein A4E49_02008 [Methanosaeta sp. PtaU1.Bin112]|nr:MAG: hypothetical protein A4E49_02008 [Methanosaeta sp. PtaU1.Bin112]
MGDYGNMSDIALISERNFLYEKLFAELKVSFQFLSPAILGSPFLPKYRMVMIPTGFANPDYSKALPALQRMRSNISDFVQNGGVLTIFGPMVPEHNYDWLPLPLRYVCELSSQNVSPSADECACLLCTSTPECDGYLIAGEGFETVLKDKNERSILVRANYGEGLIVATSVHEFPAAEYIKWALGRARPAKF